ncbi:DUF4290 domain-containing protein [Flavobacteriaceae bacterium]|nr:DUF4290 domain-containing protein [Flavobacteriaceae bacterium]MDG2289790.1 DUF4290 domain-containing protein [Flavobacteriaceae bacterium]
MIDNLQYNTERSMLAIPEYGRHIHKMIQQVLAEEDKEERNKQAQAIIGIMGNLNPHLRDVADFQHKLWDQLFIMSDFKLDVDAPFPKPDAEVLAAPPTPLAYPQSFPKYRFYGNNIKGMIDVIVEWEEGDLKQALVYVIANHMKKCFLNWNKDTVDDKVIFGHLAELSDGKIVINPEDEVLSASENLIRLTNKRFAKGSRNPKNKKYRNPKQRRK